MRLMPPRKDVVRDSLLVALAACGGALDAASYLRLHVFTANMTGSTVILGLALGGARLGDAALAVLAIASFAAGAFVATMCGAEATDADPWPARVAVPFAVEIVLLAAFAACWSALPANAPSAHAILLALGAGAMGVQSGITHDVHLSGASTTYMSGTIARAAEYLADTLRFGFRGGLVLNAVVWIVYLCVAIAVGVLDRHGIVQPILWIVVAVVAAVALLGRRAVMPKRYR